MIAGRQSVAVLGKGRGSLIYCSGAGGPRISGRFRTFQGERLDGCGKPAEFFCGTALARRQAYAMCL